MDVLLREYLLHDVKAFLECNSATLTLQNSNEKCDVEKSNEQILPKHKLLTKRIYFHLLHLLFLNSRFLPSNYRFNNASITVHSSKFL